MELSKNRIKAKKQSTEEKSITPIKETNTNSGRKSSISSKTENMHIVVNTKDKFLFLYTFLKKFSDKEVLILVSTDSQVKVSIITITNNYYP